MENLGNDFTTTLAAAITSTIGVSITVASSTGAPSPNFRINVDGELMLVTAVAHPTWTVQRGIEGSTPATHLIAATVAHVVTSEGLEQRMSRERSHSFEEVTSGSPVGIPSGRQMLTNDLRVDDDLRIDGTLVIQ